MTVSGMRLKARVRAEPNTPISRTILAQLWIYFSNSFKIFYRSWMLPSNLKYHARDAYIRPSQTFPSPLLQLTWSLLGFGGGFGGGPLTTEAEDVPAVIFSGCKDKCYQMIGTLIGTYYAPYHWDSFSRKRFGRFRLLVAAIVVAISKMCFVIYLWRFRIGTNATQILLLRSATRFQKHFYGG